MLRRSWVWTDGANALELGSLLGLGVAQRRGCPDDVDDVLHHHRLHHEDLSVKSFEQTPQDCKSMEGEHENLQPSEDPPRDPVAKSLLQVEGVRGGGDRACPPMPATREQMSATLKMFYLGCCCSTMVQNDDEVVSLETQVCTEEERRIRADVKVHLLRVCTPCAAGRVWWSEAAESGTKTGEDDGGEQGLLSLVAHEKLRVQNLRLLVRAALKLLLPFENPEPANPKFGTETPLPQLDRNQGPDSQPGVAVEINGAVVVVALCSHGGISPFGRGMPWREEFLL